MSRPSLPPCPHVADWVRTAYLAFGLLVAVAAPAQGGSSPAPAQPNPTSLLAALRARGLTSTDAAPLIADLRRCPTSARLQGSDVMRTLLLGHQKSADKARDKALQLWQKAAGRAQKERLGKHGARVDELRSEALRVTRSGDLSKEAIHAQIDPRRQELEQLLQPSVDEVRSADPKAAEAVDALRSQFAEWREWHRLAQDLVEGLEMNDDAARHLLKKPLPDPPPGDAGFDAALQAALLMGLLPSESDRSALAANEALRGSTDPEEFAGTLELNRIRFLLGLNLLRIDPKLGDAARDHATDMEHLNFFSHTSPVPGKETFGQRASRFGTSASSENIAAGHETGPGAIAGWWYSPGHHKNMLGAHQRTGLGRSAQLWTQLFGG